MNLLHYLPYLLAFMVITAGGLCLGLYRAQTADRSRQALLESRVHPASGGRCGKRAL